MKCERLAALKGKSSIPLLGETLVRNTAEKKYPTKQTRRQRRGKRVADSGIVKEKKRRKTVDVVTANGGDEVQPSYRERREFEGKK